VRDKESGCKGKAVAAETTGNKSAARQRLPPPQPPGVVTRSGVIFCYPSVPSPPFFFPFFYPLCEIKKKPLPPTPLLLEFSSWLGDIQDEDLIDIDRERQRETGRQGGRCYLSPSK
jgi:hypothetical protein